MIGTFLCERYRIEREIGRGGMGIVFCAHDTLLDRQVAVKVLSSDSIGTQGRSRLLHEARAAAKLNHPNIIIVYDAGEWDGMAFIIMELLQGETLYVHGPQALDETIQVIRQVCNALEHAHSHGIIHRDLKLENIFITDDGTVKLTDFGLARSIASRITTEGGLVGTVFYLAPEQALGEEIDGRTDLYALGVILYELTTGQLPFKAADPLLVVSQHLYAPVIPPSQFNPDLPPAMNGLILKLLNKQRGDRPQSATEVRQVLNQLAGVEEDPVKTRLVLELSPLDLLVRGRLVGREREFAEAKALWNRIVMQSGEEHVLLISGEAGVGKTPLVREIMAYAESSGAAALIGECYAEGSAPYTPIAEIIRTAITLPGIDLPDRILADLATLAPDLCVRYPDLPPNPPLDPLSEQHRLFESVVALCIAVSAQSPLLLVIEDIQWADGGTLYLIRHLARRCRLAQSRVLVVLTYREGGLDETQTLPEMLYDLNRERLGIRLKLARFNREQTQEVLKTMLQEEISPDFLDSIYRETEGNLFFIEEVCKALVEEGKLCCERGHWQRASMEEIEIPQNIRTTILSRFAKLPEQAQEILRLAAVLGREFDFETLLKAGDFDEEVLISTLELAGRAQLVHEVRGKGPEIFAFDHALIPTALKESMSSLRRRRLHRRVAVTIATLRPDDEAALAHHYGEAGDEEQARTYYIRAGERAEAVFANADAILFYSQALELTAEDDPQRFDLLAARARIMER